MAISIVLQCTSESRTCCFKQGIGREMHPMQLVYSSSALEHFPLVLTSTTFDYTSTFRKADAKGKTVSLQCFHLNWVLGAFSSSSRHFHSSWEKVLVLVGFYTVFLLRVTFSARRRVTQGRLKVLHLWYGTLAERSPPHWAVSLCIGYPFSLNFPAHLPLTLLWGVPKVRDFCPKTTWQRRW